MVDHEAIHERIPFRLVLLTQFLKFLALDSSFFCSSFPTPLANSFTINWVRRNSSLVRWGFTVLNICSRIQKHWVESLSKYIILFHLTTENTIWTNFELVSLCSFALVPVLLYLVPLCTIILAYSTALNYQFICTCISNILSLPIILTEQGMTTVGWKPQPR